MFTNSVPDLLLLVLSSYTWPVSPQLSISDKHTHARLQTNTHACANTRPTGYKLSVIITFQSRNKSQTRQVMAVHLGKYEIIYMCKKIK